MFFEGEDNMKNKKHRIKLTLKESKERVTELLLQYNYYDYESFLFDINGSSSLIVLEYRSGFSNVYQSITIIVTKIDNDSEVIIYESKTTTSLSNLLNSRKEIGRIIEFLLKNHMKILVKEEI